MIVKVDGSHIVECSMYPYKRYWGVQLMEEFIATQLILILSAALHCIALTSNVYKLIQLNLN
jgi:hypothetical protein